MRKTGIAVLFFVILSVETSFSQDKIYLASDTKQGKIVGITYNVVSYRPANESKIVNIPLRNIVLLFNEKGGYLILAGLNVREPSAKQAIADFLNQEISFWPGDRIFKTDNTQDEGKIMAEDNEEVHISTTRELKKIPKKNIALIIYKDGRHQMGSSMNLAVEKLTLLTGLYGGMYAVPALAQPAPGNIAGEVQAAPASVKNNEDNVSTLDKSIFEERVKQKTKKFGEYLTILCDKKNTQDNWNKAIDLAEGLFVDGAIVETSSLDRQQIKRRKVRAYLTEVKLLTYDHIDIEWTNVQYVDQLELAPDGTYRGTVSFEQKFSGFRDGILVYQDYTVKKAEVILKKYSKMIEGRQRTDWDILLGDIGVQYTQKTPD